MFGFLFGIFKIDWLFLSQDGGCLDKLMLSPLNMYHCLAVLTSKETFLGRVYKRGGRVVCALAPESRGPDPTIVDEGLALVNYHAL